MVNSLKKVKMENLSATLKTINKIKKDCDELEKKDDLTEYGNGQLALINMVSIGLETNTSKDKK